MSDDGTKGPRAGATYTVLLDAAAGRGARFRPGPDLFFIKGQTCAFYKGTICLQRKASGIVTTAALG